MLTDGSSVDAVTQRLFPRAYLDPTEEAAEAEWQELAHDDIVEARLTAMTDVVRSLDAAAPVRGIPDAREIVLGEEQTAHWIGVLNDARLAVGTALEVTAEWDFDLIDPDVPNYELHTLYAWMTRALGVLLGASTTEGSPDARRFRRGRSGHLAWNPACNPTTRSRLRSAIPVRWPPSSSTRSRARCGAPPTRFVSRWSRCSRAGTSSSRACPARARRLLAKSLAAAIGGHYGRVQCTPDLLPADVTGTSVYGPASGIWDFRPGPVFANVVLVDEVNRASPRTQAALLEPMEERQVTVDGATHQLPDPFFVVATQNPFGSAGTFPLPESQLDRFALVCTLGLPGRVAEREILDGQGGVDALDALAPVTVPAELAATIAAVRGVHCAHTVRDYVLDVADATRNHPGSRSVRRRAPASRCCAPRRRTRRSWVATSCRPTT